MLFELVLGLVVAFALAVYLIVTLVASERF